MKFIKAINSIWKNLLFDFVVGLILIAVVLYNLHGRQTTSVKFSLVLYFLLWAHFVVLLTLAIINLFQRTYIKAIVFILTSVGLFFGLQFITVVLFLSAMDGRMPGGDAAGHSTDFRQITTCKEFDTTKVKTTIENMRLGIYTSQLDSNLINQVKSDTNAFPKKISKITCGCRTFDTSVIIFRLWDRRQQTFELKMKNKGGQWKYTLLTMEDFN